MRYKLYTPRMNKELAIQEVAQITGLSVYTLRYYERIGLLDNIERADSGHRRYNTDDLQWLQFLVYLRSTGMSIRQMQYCAELKRGGEATRPERLAFLEAHRLRVHEQIQKLEKFRDYTDRIIDYLQASGETDQLLEKHP